MKNKRKNLQELGRVFILVCATCLSMGAYADSNTPLHHNKNTLDLHYDISAGWAIVDDVNYEPGYVVDQSFVVKKVLNFRFGFLYIDDIEPLLNGTDSTPRIEIDGPYLAASKSFQIKIVDLALGVGVLKAETEAFLFGRKTARDTDTAPFLHAQAHYALNNQFSLFGDWKYFDRLSGGRLHLAQMGVRISF
ncbi:MAG: hypothetical protein K6L76_14065 [Agarilytica sp.]